MKNSYILLLVLTTLQSYAQYPSYEWGRRVGGTGREEGFSIDTDDAGNVYLTGGFNESMDLDPFIAVDEIVSNGKTDIFIQKLNKGGFLEWGRHIGGPFEDGGRAICADRMGNVFTTGKFQGEFDFNPGSGTFQLANQTQHDSYYVQKLNSEGDFQWAIGGQESGRSGGISIDTDGEGNAYVLGFFNDTLEVGHSRLISAGLNDIFIQKLSAKGGTLWSRRIGGSKSDFPASIKVDEMGNSYISGVFQSTVDFDPAVGMHFLAGSENHANGFVLKLDPDGFFEWVLHIKSTQDGIRAGNIALDADNNVYNTGVFTSSAQFITETGSETLSGVMDNIFVQKIDAEGKLLWLKQLDSTSLIFAPSMAVDAQKNVYVSASFGEQINLDPEQSNYSLVAVDGFDSFTLKLDSTGQFAWARHIGGNDAQISRSVATSPNKDVYVMGEFGTEVDLDMDGIGSRFISMGSTDLFLQKLSQCGILLREEITACSPFTWRNGLSYTDNVESLVYRLPDAAPDGCDSVFVLNLTINKVSDNTVTSGGTTIIANNANASYQWLDCDDDYAPIEGEQAQDFRATVNGNFAVALTENSNGCKDTSDCVAILTVATEDYNAGPTFKVYPNPGYDHFFIDLAKAYNTARVYVLDSHGQEIAHYAFKNTERLYVPLREMAGIYYARVVVPDRVTVLKLIKN